MTQCIFDPGTGGDAHAKAESVRAEFVLAVRGSVTARPSGTENAKLATGEASHVLEGREVYFWQARLTKKGASHD